MFPCNYFTFHSQDNERGYCVLMENCNAIAPDNCNDCITGHKNTQQECFPRRGFCQVIQNKNKTENSLKSVTARIRALKRCSSSGATIFRG